MRTLRAALQFLGMGTLVLGVLIVGNLALIAIVVLVMGLWEGVGR